MIEFDILKDQIIKIIEDLRICFNDILELSDVLSDVLLDISEVYCECNRKKSKWRKMFKILLCYFYIRFYKKNMPYDRRAFIDEDG
jgi:hypothetical protein